MSWIYLGDGKVIHAGSEATGILISDFNYEKSTEFAVPGDFGGNT